MSCDQTIVIKMVVIVVKMISLSMLGTLGVVTEVSLKIRPIAPVRKYASFVFPDFETGTNFMREVARQVSYLDFCYLDNFSKIILMIDM